MSSGWIVFLNGACESEGAFLDQIKQIKTFPLVTLGQIDNKAQIGRDHLILRPLAAANHHFFLIAVVACWPGSAGKMTTFSDGYHRLNLSPHHQFLFRGQQLVAADFSKKST